MANDKEDKKEYPVFVEPSTVSDNVPAVLQKERTLPEKFARKMPIRNISWAIAIVSVIIFLIISAYFGFFLKTKRNKAPDKNKMLTLDVAPGGNRATLTLGNGVTMILDSEAIGRLAHQGNTVILKTDSALVYSIVNNNQSEKPAISEENILTTPRGGQYQLVLPDGTKVWLNASSSITYPTAFTGKQRFVMITGEVYFEVVHNASFPFVVKTVNQVITDLGTCFNIELYPDEGAITTSVLQGSVKIYVGSKANLLFSGQQEIASVTGESITIKNKADIDKVVAWHNGEFSLTDITTRQLMAEISRWYDMDIEFEGAIPNGQFHGSIKRNLPLSALLKELRAFGIDSQVEGKKIKVQ